jgi:hypothetical protein
MVKALKTFWVLAFWLTVSGPARSDSATVEPVRLAYDIFIGGILAGTVDVTFQSMAGSYHIVSTARSHGILDFLVGFRGQNEVSGRIQQGQVRPMEYKATGNWAGEARSVDIHYGPAGGVRFQARPPAEEDEREPVPDHLVAGTTDPLSAWLQTMLRVKQSARCGGGVEDFDGRRRYDITLEELTAEEGARPPYTGPPRDGPARVCRARQNLIAGVSHRTWLPQFARPEWFDIWIAKVRDDLPLVPVRLRADLGIVDLVAHLVAIGGRKSPPGEGLPSPALAGQPNTDLGARR